MPGKYLVIVTGYGGYVKSVRLGETTGDGPVLNLNQGSGGAAVTVTLSSAYGEISGTVQDNKGPAAGAQWSYETSATTSQSCGRWRAGPTGRTQ